MLEEIFAPQSVAVVGASPDPTRLGHRVLANVVENGYKGRIYPIPPTAPLRPTRWAWVKPHDSDYVEGTATRG